MRMIDGVSDLVRQPIAKIVGRGVGLNDSSGLRRIYHLIKVHHGLLHT
jgi:hypothetical protein